jgi:hypothetical protein
MTTQPERRPSLIDGMILIAATAIALAFESSAVTPAFSRALDFVLFRTLRFLVELLVTCSFASLLVRFSRPRPASRDLIRTPGFVASAVASAGSGVAICRASVSTCLQASTRRYDEKTRARNGRMRHVEDGRQTLNRGKWSAQSLS